MDNTDVFRVMADALGRNLYRGHPPETGALDRVQRYVRATAAALAGQGVESLLAGQVRFAELEP